MSKKLDKLWDKYIRLTHRRAEIQRTGKGLTFCSNCYKEASRTAENEGYSSCCNELILGQEEICGQLTDEVLEGLNEIDKEIENE